MRFNLIIAAALLSLGILPAPARDEKPDKKFLQETIAAAENGDPAAQCALGACFESGAGMLKDLDQAAKWYRRAAAQGDAMAECALASCYERGQGVKKDLAEAAKFYTQAAEQGYTRAQLKLGAFYAEGTGVAKDLAQAYKWYQPAAAKGDETARKALRKLEKSLTSAQLAAAKQPPGRAAFSPAPEASKPALARSAPAPLTNNPLAQVLGVGFFITDDGFLITAAHLVKGTSPLALMTRAGRVTAKVVKLDATDGLALLKAEGKFTPLPVAPSRALRAGARLSLTTFLSSNVETFAPQVATGEVSSLVGAQDDPRYFQVAAPLGQAGLGAALTDQRGNVVGVLGTSPAMESTLPEGVHAAIKSSFLLAFLESVPELSARLPEPHLAAPDSNTVAESLPDASAQVLGY